MSNVTGSETPQYSAQGSGPSGPRAGFWVRFAAYLIDTILVSIVEVIVFVILHKAVALAYVINLVIVWGYFIALEGGPTGQTLGMKALGIRVLDFGQGGSIGYGRAFLRQLVKIISAAVIFLGYLWMLWDREKQTWQDKAANSVVVPVSAYPV
jgi:uncharacterized RDD family membrane protein YckC